MFADGPVNLYMSYDTIFISTIFGGWKSAILALGMNIFGTSTHLHLATIDMIISTLVAYGLRNLLSAETLQLSRIRDIFTLALCRVVATSWGPIIFEFTGIEPTQSGFDILFRRVINSMTVSLVIIALMTKLFRREMTRNNELYLDPLCKLPNRRALQRDLEGLDNDDAQIQQQATTILLVKLENIRELIQFQGHAWADIFMKRIGQLLCKLQHDATWQQLHAKAYLFREGIFILKLNGITAESVFETNLANLAHKTLNTNDNAHKYTLAPTFSIGVVDVNLPSNFKADRFLRALNLYERRSTATVYRIEQNIVDTILQASKIRIRIEQWIANETADICLQPKVNLKNNACIGAECLLRMRTSCVNEICKSTPIACHSHQIQSIRRA